MKVPIYPNSISERQQAQREPETRIQCKSLSCSGGSHGDKRRRKYSLDRLLENVLSGCADVHQCDDVAFPTLKQKQWWEWGTERAADISTWTTAAILPARGDIVTHKSTQLQRQQAHFTLTCIFLFTQGWLGSCRRPTWVSLEQHQGQKTGMCVRSHSLVITVHGIFWVFSTRGGWSPSYLTVHCSDPWLFDEILITAQFRAATRLLYLIEVKCHNWLTLTCPLYLHTTQRLIPSGLEGCITVGCNHFQTAAKWTKLSRLLHIVLLLRGSFALFAVFA